MSQAGFVALIIALLLGGCNKQPPQQPPVSPPTTNTVSTLTTETNRGYGDLALSSSSPNALHQRTPSPPVSDLFKSQIIKFFEESGKLDQQNAQGVNIPDLKDRLATAKALLEIARSIWPESVPTNALNKFDETMTAWSFAAYLSERDQKMQAETKEELELQARARAVMSPDSRLVGLEIILVKYTPAELEKNTNEFLEKDNDEFQRLVDFGGDKLVFSRFPDNFSIRDCRGRRYLPLKENVKVMLEIGSNRLKGGREDVLKVLR